MEAYHCVFVDFLLRLLFKGGCNQHWDCCRCAYFCCRFDGKARAETNCFDRYYNCMRICEACLAEKPTKKSNPAMWYHDFRECAPRHLTRIDDTTYRNTCKVLSPWHHIAGWTLGTAMHDFMHVIYLGTARDLIGSLIADMLDCGVLGPSDIPVAKRLRQLSILMHRSFKEKKSGAHIGPFYIPLCFFMFGARSGVVGALRLGVRKLVFTESNCGLTEGFPELGSAWKAANVKLVLWFIAEKAVEFAKATGVFFLHFNVLFF